MSIVDEVIEALSSSCLSCGCRLLEVVQTEHECQKARKCVKCGVEFEVWTFGGDTDESKQD
jgi:hypothetical protein